MQIIKADHTSVMEHTMVRLPSAHTTYRGALATTPPLRSCLLQCSAKSTIYSLACSQWLRNRCLKLIIEHMFLVKMAAEQDRPEHRVIFCTENFLQPSDPKDRPVLIVGLSDHLKHLDFSRVEKYLAPRVNKVGMQR